MSRTSFLLESNDRHLLKPTSHWYLHIVMTLVVIGLWNFCLPFYAALSIIVTTLWLLYAGNGTDSSMSWRNNTPNTCGMVLVVCLLWVLSDSQSFLFVLVCYYSVGGFLALDWDAVTAKLSQVSATLSSAPTFLQTVVLSRSSSITTNQRESPFCVGVESLVYHPSPTRTSSSSNSSSSLLSSSSSSSLANRQDSGEESVSCTRTSPTPRTRANKYKDLINSTIEKPPQKQSTTTAVLDTGHILDRVVQSERARGSPTSVIEEFDNNYYSKCPVFSSTDLKVIDEDPLTFFRHFLSQDKQRQQGQSSDLKKQNKRQSNPKVAVTPTTPTTKETYKPLSSSDVEDPRVLFRTFLHEDLQKHHPTNPKLQTPIRTQPIILRSSKTNSNDGSNINHNTKAQDKRAVRFADEEGKSLEMVFEIDQAETHDDDDDSFSCIKRVLVLLVLPREQLFEYVGIEYSTADDGPGRDKENYNSGILVSHVLQQLPNLASDKTMTKQRFVKLLRACATTNTKSNSEKPISLIPSLSIQSYHLRSNEVLVAVPEGYYCEQQILESSKSVVQNKKLLRTLKRNKWWWASLSQQERLR